MKLYIPVLAGLLIGNSGVFAQSSTAGQKISASPSLAVRTQGMNKNEGYFTFYYDEKEGRVLLEIPDKMLNKEFLYVNAMPEGGGGAGDRGTVGGYRIVKFIKVGPKIFLTLPNYDYRADSGGEAEKKSVSESFPQSVIWGFKPDLRESDKTLIDITSFLLRDSQNAGARLGSSGFSRPGAPVAGGGNVYRVDESRSAIAIERTKSFPKNTEFEALLTFAGAGTGERSFFSGGPGTPAKAPDPGSITLKNHHSFIELPDQNYKPRAFDPRSGYNSMEYLDFSTATDEPVLKKFIRRWRLEKKNPGAAKSEAVKPIVFYVDKGAPEPIRKALIEGTSWWNDAFEAAGFINAFQVKELPDGADPMDIRYSMINWVHRPQRGFSNGIGIFDPRTGEIIKGQVTLGSMRDKQDFLILQGLTQPYGDDKSAAKKAVDQALARMKQLAAHEVGHALGMYHNHMSSSNDRSSVTDYPFPKITMKADGSMDISEAYAKGIGSYDKRAIIWGYTEFGKNQNEKAELDKIIRESIRQGHIFMFDLGIHPNSAHWDNTNDAVAELTRLMQIRKKALSVFSEKTIPEGRPMATMEEVLVPLYLLHRYQIEAATNLLGGLDFRYALRGDGQPVTGMIDPAQQWQALDALISSISAEELAIPESVIKNLPPYPIGYARNQENFKGYTGVTFDPVGAAESLAGQTLSLILDHERAARLLEYHGRDDKQPGLISVIEKLNDKIWKAPAEKGYRADLQSMVRKVYLKTLLGVAAQTGASDNVKATILAQIDNLKVWMSDQKSTADTRLKGDILFSLLQISQFEKDPDKFKPLQPAQMPAGPAI
jgi:hypothetical protein